MALKSPYDPEDQIYEHLVQSSDSAILSKELPAMYILPSLPVRHQGLRETCTAFTGALIAEYHFLSTGQLLPEFIYCHQVRTQAAAGCGHTKYSCTGPSAKYTVKKQSRVSRTPKAATTTTPSPKPEGPV